MQRRKAQRDCRTLDATVRSPHILRSPLPSEILSELRAFTQKFGPALFQASINALDLVRDPVKWRAHVVLVVLQRFSDFAPGSRPWTRYVVHTVVAAPVRYVVDEMGGAEHEFVQRKREQEVVHQAAGQLGTITVLVCASCVSTEPPRLMHNVAFYGFGLHSLDAVDVSDDWLQTFKANVEEMCGRRSAT